MASIDRTWQHKAECKKYDPNLWFADQKDYDSFTTAKRICNESCEVRDQCLEYALAKGEHYGIWGGLGERQRNSLRTKLKRTQEAAS